MDNNYGYRCDFTIQNPYKLNNFTNIDGIHLDGKGDDDVEFIFRVRGSSTANIPSIICDTFQYTTRIDLGSIGIQSVDDFSFKNCKKITHLSLYSNKITKIDEKSFNKNLELESLSLWGNQLTTLPEKVFANQHKLKILRIDTNKITDLPKNIFKSLSNLKELHLHYNQIKNLKADWFKNLKKLNQLYLFNNQIEKLPRKVFSALKNLTFLSIGFNKLKIIHSESFGILPNLIEFRAYNNKIKAVNERIFDNTGVQRLMMTGNLCTNVSGIVDNSTSKQQIRNLLQTCFNNYENLYPEPTTPMPTTTIDLTLPPGCVDGNTEERICRLEDKTENLEKENSRFDALASTLKEHNADQDKIIENLERLIENQSKIIENQKAQIANLGSLVQDLEGSVEGLEGLVEEQSKKFSAALQEMEEKIVELLNRPCDCPGV